MMMRQRRARLHSASYFTILLFLGVCLTPSVLEAQVSGTVFRDFNGNGTKDTNEPLISGVTVNAYSTAGTLCGATATAGVSAPNYSLTGCGTASIRVEFIMPTMGSCANSANDYSALSGATYGSSVQFVNGNSTNVNFAVHNPSDYNTGTTGVNVFIPCYITGDPLPASSPVGAADWFVGYPYTNSGNTTTLPPSQKLNGAIIGSTWGVAYSKQAQKVFTSALLKRHVGLGTLGSGGIYMLTPTANSFTVNSFYDMDANGHRTRADASAPAYGEGTSYSIAADNATITYLGSTDALTGKPSGLGVIGTNVERGLSTAVEIPSYDPAAFDQVGKVGLGDIDISDDGKYLFVMNLYSRKVFRLELDNAYNPTSVVSVTSYDVPATTCTNGEYRPWGLKFYRDKLYVGLVCSGENGGTTTNLTASVYELTSPTASATFNTTAVLTLPLDYNKSGDYNPWTRNSGVVSSSGAIRYATPILSDIEFTDNGDMALGIMDRCGHQWGENNRKFLKVSATFVTISTSGDILVAGLNCSTGAFALENNGTVTSANGAVLIGSSSNTNQGPGGKEFFDDNSASGDPHDETATGALAVLKGQGQILLSAFAQSSNSGDAGTMKLATTNGTFVNYYELYNRTNFDGVFAKANGLGDIELSGIEAPLEIGNRIWSDTDSDGIQDADEAGIDGVTVKLFEGATEVGSTTTTNGGQYYFTNANVTGGVKYNTAYEIRIGTAQAPLSTLSITTTDVGSNGSDLIDNDGSTSGANVIKTFTTGNAGENNHSYDFGFYPFCDTTLTVSNTTICNGSMVNLFVLASGVKGTLTYSTNGTTWTALANPTNVTPLVSTTYFIKDTLTSGCFDIDTLVITVRQPVTAGVGTNPASATCQAGSGLATINLAGQITGATSGGTWSQTSGTAVGTALTTATGVLNPNGIAVGTYTFRYTVVGTSPCPNDTEDITITIQNCCPPNICIPVTVARN